MENSSTNYQNPYELRQFKESEIIDHCLEALEYEKGIISNGNVDLFYNDSVEESISSDKGRRYVAKHDKN